METDKEWLESEIGKLERELPEAKARLADAGYALARAKAKYKAAKEAAESVAGCIRSIKYDLAIMTDLKS
jgi:chromosome segregation ATPase